MNEEIYPPSEDSFLMREFLLKIIPNLLKEKKNLKILEIGTGSGIQLESFLKLGIKKENIFSCDINPRSVEHCRKLGFDCIQSDLFQNIPKRDKFEIIIFNPPYLPEDKNEPINSRIATTGGKNGSEIINRFLKSAKSHLNIGGKVFLITSSLTKEINWLNYNKKLLEKKKLFFEELYVWELT